VAVSGGEGRILVVSLDTGAARSLDGFPAATRVGRAAFSPDGRRLAAGLHGGRPAEKVIRVWDLDTGRSRTYGPLPGAGDLLEGGISDVAFAGADRLLASIGGVGLISLDLASGSTRVVLQPPIGPFAVAPGGRFGVAMRHDRLDSASESREAVRFDLERGTVEVLPHGTDVGAIALDPTGSLVATGASDGSIRVSRVSGEAPHLLLGQAGSIYSLAFSPDGKKLAASGEAFAFRIWPVPDVSTPPLHLLPHDALLSVLRSHTNLRAVPDAASPTGYRLEPGPFQGWASVPGF
jgi:WD40 repeat protein